MPVPTTASGSWSIASGPVACARMTRGRVSRYEAELRGSPALEELRKLTRGGVVTLVTATRDLDISPAAVLANVLKGR